MTFQTWLETQTLLTSWHFFASELLARQEMQTGMTWVLVLTELPNVDSQHLVLDLTIRT